MRKFLLAGAVATAVVAGSTVALASPPPPAVVTTNGSCPANYNHLVSVTTVWVCTRAYQPQFEIRSSPCATGWVGVGVDDSWVCVTF